MRVKHSLNNTLQFKIGSKQCLRARNQCMFFSFLIFVSCLFSRSASALSYQSPVDVQFTFNPYISLAVSGDLVINDLAPGNSADSNIITITASSNSPAGYALYSSVGSSTYDYTDLRLSSTNTTNVFTNLSSNVASLSNFSDNTWGYSYSTDSGSTWQSGDADSTPASGYSGLPLYSTITYTDLETSETINTGVKLVNAEKNTATEVQFKIGAKASTTQVTGTYTNVVNFINVAKIVTTNYTIDYNANVGTTGDTVTNMPTTTSGTTTSGTVTLSTNVPTRDNYIFKGWCDVDNSSDQSTCSDGTNTGTITQPGGIYALNTTNNSATVDMYAVWEDATPKLYFQDATSADCGETMYDNRGNGTYKNVAYTTATINGLCWMTRNLDLPGGTTLTSSDSNVTSDYTLPASSTSGFSDNSTAYVYNSNSITCTNDSPCYSYYSYVAATVGTNPSSGEASSDICPKGWRLPTSAELYSLKNTYTTGTALTATPFLGVYAGEYSKSLLNDGGSYGQYWSSTASNNNNSAWSLSFNNGNAYVYASNTKYVGRSIRCVAKS